MVRNFGQTVPLEKPPEKSKGAPPPAPAPTVLPVPKVRPSRLGRAALIAGSVLSLLWLCASAAFAWGFWGPQGLLQLSLAAKAALAAALLLPPFLFLAMAAALSRSAAMTDATRALMVASERLFAADETAANNAARLARAVRRELDGLNTGLDVAFQRMRTLEAVLEKQIATLDDAGARAQVRGDTIAARLNQESGRIETLGDLLTDAAGRAGETVAGRTAQLRAMMESAEGTLKMATQTLDVQAAGFRAAVTQASETPLEAAKLLEEQASRIAEISDTAIGRAEFVLARHEKHRGQMGELVQKLKEESESFESVLAQQRAHMEQAIQALSSETQSFSTVTGDAERHLDTMMANAVNHAAQLTSAFMREAERLKEMSDGANDLLASLSAQLKEAGTGAQTLIGETAAQAQQDARLLVGEAMAECERLLRASGEMSAEASKIRNMLNDTTKDMEKHLSRLPGMAEEEARRVRQLITSETDQLLSLSARTMNTLHARSTGKVTPPDLGGPMKPQAPEPEPEGLKGLARKLTARKSAAPRPAETKWEMKTLLAAAEENDDIRPFGASKSDKLGLNPAATLGALELALADMAIDLSALDTAEPGDEDWK